MPRTRFTNMQLLRMAVSVISLSGKAGAQPACYPLTQYERNGECCKMCAPGTRMSSLSTCLDPQCPECGDNEYRETYTTEPRCRRQPYCDPNKNFGAIVNKSKSQRSACECKLGFHCSSGDCITCVPHTLCGPGHGARSIGNHTHNTMCQKCTEGTFSEDESWNGVCEKWTECLEGHNVEQSGTGVSDNICEESSRSHAVVIVVCSVIVFLFVVICACGCCLCKGKPGDAKGNVKVCVELCLGDKKEPPRETKVLIINPTDAIEEESLVPDRQSSQEEADARTPEENEDELSQELSDDYVLTDNGNFVTQEDGKSAVLSRQESQTQTLQTETSCGHSDRW